MKKIISRVLAGCICLFLTSCLPSKAASPEIIHGKLGKYDLYIPREYVKFGHTSVGSEDALIQAWYPGSAIVPGDDPTELAKAKLWKKNIRILISSQIHSTKSFSEVAAKNTEYLHATEIVGKEYGLIHKTQPDGLVKDAYDVWFEMDGNEIISYITCSEKLTKTDNPQCSHYLRTPPGFRLKISYKRDFLPEWALIKKNVEEMFVSFQSEETAEDFIRLRIQDLETSHKK